MKQKLKQNLKRKQILLGGITLLASVFLLFSIIIAPANVTAQNVPAKPTNTTTNQTKTNTNTAPVNYDTNASEKGLVQCGNEADNPCTVEDVFNIFVIMTNLLIGMAGIIAIIAIMWAGFSMVKAAGSQEGIASAKKSLTNAIIGLILVFLAFIIINSILYGTLGIGVFGGDGILGGNPSGYIDQAGSNNANSNSSANSTNSSSTTPSTNTPKK